MTVGIVGLGLIGGSLAKTFKFRTDYTVLGTDCDEMTIKRAGLIYAIDGTLSNDNLKECEYLFLALYPKACIKYLEQNVKFISKNTIVIDCCGVKQAVCNEGFKLAKKHGFTFVGGHPMAGTQFSGFTSATHTMFTGASMVLVPEHNNDIKFMARLRDLFLLLGFKNVTFSTAQKHDEIIAFTSQLAHVVSNAYVKSPTAKSHQGYSAGSYKDLTRVAHLNPKMWADLFLKNSDHLIFEIDNIITELTKYKDALSDGNSELLQQLLKEGSELKDEIDKK
ncbi:MAG: prephenate dehydrogenase [Clostridia bacterium]|nr:prephenate dehydrogenase [Clostridia bacterium]